MSGQLIIICSHLRDDALLPCVQILEDPVGQKDAGETYLCLDCAAIPDPCDIPDENLLTACKGCCESFTILETCDART